MKVIIYENERGYLFRNGSFIKFLGPGKYGYLGFLGYTVTKVRIEGAVHTNDIDINVLMKDKDFAESITRVSVPDNKIALHYVDDRLIGALTSGEYAFWNIF